MEESGIESRQQGRSIDPNRLSSDNTRSGSSCYSCTAKVTVPLETNSNVGCRWQESIHGELFFTTAMARLSTSYDGDFVFE